METDELNEKEAEDLSNLDNIKQKIIEMYEKMGLDPDDITEDEFGRIMTFYLKNPKKLKEDLLNIENNGDSRKGT